MMPVVKMRKLRPRAQSQDLSAGSLALQRPPCFRSPNKGVGAGVGPRLCDGLGCTRFWEEFWGPRLKGPRGPGCESCSDAW